MSTKIKLLLLLVGMTVMLVPVPAAACSSSICWLNGDYLTCCGLQPTTGGGCYYARCETQYCPGAGGTSPVGCIDVNMP